MVDSFEDALRRRKINTDYVDVDFPRRVSTKELELIFRLSANRRGFEYSTNSNHSLTVTKGFPPYKYLSGICGMVKCTEPLGNVLFDVKIERIAERQSAKYEIAGLKFLVGKVGNYVGRDGDLIGNPEIVGLVRQDIGAYFAEHPNSQV